MTMFEFKLPDIGEGVTEGEIVKWHVKEGDRLSKDQDMVEVMTDKVTVKIPSPVEGTVKKLFFSEGDIVQVGESLIQIDSGEGAPVVEEKKEIQPEVPEPERKVEEAKAIREEGARVLASPAVRRVAREKGIDLSLIEASGPGGRVTLEDLEQFESGKEIPVSEKPVEKVVSYQMVPAQRESADQVLEPRGLRRLIFEKMAKSKAIMPHFTIMEEVKVTQIREIIDNLRSQDVKVTFTPFFAKASATALKEFPYLNSIYDEQNKRYIIRKSYNMGIAIDTPDGLTVAVVKNADKKSVIEISAEISDLAKRAREGKLELHEVQDSTFTVSNVGSIGGIMSTPIINYPEVAILGVHRIRKEVDQNGVERDKMYLSLSCDHRLIDGALAARFIARLKEMIENPFLFLVQ